MVKRPQSGTDIDLGNRCSQIAYGWAKKTFANREKGAGSVILKQDGGFASVVDYYGVRIGITSDGVGTKIELAERTAIYDTLGFDLVAMVADDLAAGGLEPANISNILDVDHLDASVVEALMRGLNNAADFARLTITGGEIAELGGRIKGYGKGMHFNWAATAVGWLHSGWEAIEGQHIRPGDYVIALRSHGFRSNGFSLIRRIMQKRFGDDWHQIEYENNRTWGEVLLTPSLIYAPAVSALRRAGLKINGLAHITGGGIMDNLARILKSRELGAKLEDLFPAHEPMRRLQELGNISEQEAYGLWNMGNGMLLIAPEAEHQTMVAMLNDMKYQAQPCGRIDDDPRIAIQTRGLKPQTLIQQLQ